MRYCVLFVIIVMAGASVLGNPTDPAESFEPQFKPTIRATRVNGEVKVDGRLSEDVWRQAARATGFAENGPGDQVKPERESEALVAYDESNLYIALIAYDNPDDVRVSMRQRDQIFQDDYFGIMLDTYGDQSWGYEIFVNPLGIQGDLRMQSNGYEDISFDIIFESEGIVTDSGYQVELAIPFASLRFPDRDVQNWSINFWRDRQRDNRYRYTWAAQDRDNSCFICQWGALTGIENIKSSTNLQIIPNITAFQSGSQTDWNPDAPFVNSDPDAAVSLTTRYGLTSSSSVELTVNPDFSQVESDAGQIDVNSAFALSFPERRPFFQEGSDLFDSYIDVVHTRTINDPLAAAKFTGQFGRTSVAWVLGFDETSTLVVPFAEYSTRPMMLEKSAVNIFRLRQTFGEDSRIGLIATDRRMGDFAFDGTDRDGGYGSVLALDGSIRLSNSDQIWFIGVGSWTKEPDAPDLYSSSITFDRGRHTEALDGEFFRGHAMGSGYQHQTAKLSYGCSYSEMSPTFRADNGLVRMNDRRDFSGWAQMRFRPNREWLIDWMPAMNFGRAWSHSGRMVLDPGSFDGGAEDEWIATDLFFTLKGQTNVQFGYLYSRERYAGKVIPGISRVSWSVNSRPWEMLSGSVYGQFGNTIYRRDIYDPRLGQELSLGLSLTIRPTQRLISTSSLDYARMDNRDSYMKSYPDSSRELFSGYILWNRLTYQCTRELNLRVIVQYNDFAESLSIEPLLTYQINPFTLFYAGVTSQYQYYRANSLDTEAHALNPINRTSWEQNARQFFMKIQYLFRA